VGVSIGSAAHLAVEAAEARFDLHGGGRGGGAGSSGGVAELDGLEWRCSPRAGAVLPPALELVAI
jgi:hypothetical protein